MNVTFSELDESVLKVMNSCIKENKSDEIDTEEVEGIEEDENSVMEIEDLASKIVVLEKLLRRKERIIEEYKEELEVLRAQVRHNKGR